jgi:hypothetical protein
MTWRVGVSCVDITPPLHIPELGFIPRQHRFQGVHDQLFAKALAAETDDGAAIIVTADAIGFHRNLLGDDKDFIAEFRKRVSQVTGVAFDAIMLAASHAHSTPETIGLTPLREVEGAAEWVEVLLDKLVACAINAWKEENQRRHLLLSAKLSAWHGVAASLARTEKFTACPTDHPMNKLTVKTMTRNWASCFSATAMATSFWSTSPATRRSFKSTISSQPIIPER